jgi:hypothetical protein
VPALNALSRTTALIQLGRDVGGDLVLNNVGLFPGTGTVSGIDGTEARLGRRG